MLLICHLHNYHSFPYTLDWSGSTIELSPDLDADGRRRSMHRVMQKNGHENVVFRRIPEKSWRYMRDAITTLVRSVFGHKASNKTQQLTSERSNIYSITPSIQRKLDELANESPTTKLKYKHMPKPHNGEREKVTFSI